ncbi:tetratricopeptide repeat protein, partial [Candidatus Dojkabacteria bacterium]|nr:tetratricopeptide repeat protein [Candidatus Dojkabacteria bacterium]
MKVIQKLTIILLIVFTLSACINNTEPSDHYQEGNSFLENYQYSLALEQYKLAINDKPGNPDAYLAAADILMLKGDTEEAKEILVLAIEQAEPLAEIHERLGTIYLKQGDFQKALEYFNTGLEISPNYENLIKLKLDALSLLDLLDERVEYAKTINDDKLSQEMLLVKGIILFEDKELSLQVLDEAKKGDNTAVADSANEAIASITSISADEDTLFNMSQLSFTLLKYDYFEIALPLNNKIIESNEYYETGYL